MARGNMFATDTDISMPVAPTERPVLVDLGGFGFTTGGIAHHITSADVEEMLSSFYQPSGVELSSIMGFLQKQRP